MPNQEKRFDLAAQIIQRIRRVRPRFVPDRPVGRKLFQKHPPAHYLDLARERGVDAVLLVLPAGWLKSERVASEQPDTLPDSPDVRRAIAEAEESNAELDDLSACDDGNSAGFDNGLAVSGPGTRRELLSPSHWEPVELASRVMLRWLPARSEWVTEAERELANIACLCQQGLTSREISDKLKLNIRLVQRRIRYLLSFQRDAANIVAKE